MGPFQTPARNTLLRHANLAVGILFDAINEAREVLEACKRERNAPGALASTRVIGQLAAKAAELGVGKAMRLDVNLRHQEDLPDYGQLPADLQAALDPILDQWREKRLQAPQPRMLMGDAKRVE